MRRATFYGKVSFRCSSFTRGLVSYLVTLHCLGHEGSLRLAYEEMANWVMLLKRFEKTLIVDGIVIKDTNAL